MTGIELDAALATAAVHRDRMLAALAHLGARLPRNGPEALAMAYDDVASAELLLSRFAKLQDVLGAKVFRFLAELTAEPLPANATFLDLLHRLEKIGAIPSAAGWRRLRDLRNDLAHDYPDDPEQAAATLAAVVAAVPELVAVDAAVRAHVARVRRAA